MRVIDNFILNCNALLFVVGGRGVRVMSSLFHVLGVVVVVVVVVAVYCCCWYCCCFFMLVVVVGVVDAAAAAAVGVPHEGVKTVRLDLLCLA